MINALPCFCYCSEGGCQCHALVERFGDACAPCRGGKHHKETDGPRLCAGVPKGAIFGAEHTRRRC